MRQSLPTWQLVFRPSKAPSRREELQNGRWLDARHRTVDASYQNWNVRVADRGTASGDWLMRTKRRAPQWADRGAASGPHVARASYQCWKSESPTEAQPQATRARERNRRASRWADRGAASGPDVARSLAMERACHVERQGHSPSSCGHASVGAKGTVTEARRATGAQPQLMRPSLSQRLRRREQGASPGMQ